MADLQRWYSKFRDKITLSPTKRDYLRTSRDNLRSHVRAWFSMKGMAVPRFCWQGSYAMKTLINPLSDGEYDLDDGIYIDYNKDSDGDYWPASSTVHSWIKSAVTGQTNALPINKDTCVRVCYSKGYHIDLPAYIMKNDVAFLAHKNKGWLESDPKAFRTWFLAHVNSYGEQLRSIVKYLKAWKDYKRIPLKGIEITILATENFFSCPCRDDIALQATVENIIKNLKVCFCCIKPVAPYEDLFDDASQFRKDNILRGLMSLKRTLDEAINEDDEITAALVMKSEFGERFPLGLYI